MYKVLTIDEHPIVHEGLKRVFARTCDIVVVAEACSVNEALGALKSHRPDVIVLDVSQPSGMGLDFLKRLKTSPHDTLTLAFGAHDHDHIAIRVLKAGAAGYIAKQASPDELITALRKVAAGGCYVSDALGERLASDLRTGENKLPHERLSNREYQVMCLLASGNTVSELARDLCLSVQTISTHRRRILDKMNLASNAALTYYGVTNGLIG